MAIPLAMRYLHGEIEHGQLTLAVVRYRDGHPAEIFGLEEGDTEPTEIEPEDDAQDFLVAVLCEYTPENYRRVLEGQ